MFRAMQRKDIDQVCALIHELAAHEGRPGYCTINPRSLERGVFEKSYLKGAVIEADGKCIGYILYYFGFSSFKGKTNLKIEDLYVRPDYRGQGYGRKSFAYLAAIALENECNLMEWGCVPGNISGLQYYEHMGALVDDSHIMLYLDEQNMIQLSGMWEELKNG